MTTLGDRQFTTGTKVNSARCSFCNSGPEKVGELIEASALPGCTPAYICNECADLCSSIFERRKMIRGAAEQPDQSIINAASRKLLEAKIDESLLILTSLESHIIKLRNGLADGYTYSCEEVGRLLHIAPERVAELEMAAVAKLRKPEPQS